MDENEPLSAMDAMLSLDKNKHEKNNKNNDDPLGSLSDILRPKSTSTTSKRPRGRPRGSRNSTRRSNYSPSKPAKRRRRQSSDDDSSPELPDDSDEEVMSSHEPTGSGSGSDENDPLWKERPSRSRRAKKQFGSYNVKKIFEEQILKAERQQATAKSKRKAPNRSRGRPSKKTSDPLSHIKMNPEELIVVRDQSHYLPILPSPFADPPADSDKAYVSKIYVIPAIKNGSIAFQRFVMAITDEMTLALYNHVKAHYSFPQQTNDVLQIAQMLRHVWNSIPIGLRRQWENVSRWEEQEKYRKGNQSNPVTLEEDEEHEADSGLFRKKLDALDQNKLPVMPPSELPFPSSTGSLESQTTFVQAQCCDGLKFNCFQDVQKHYLSAHYTTMTYACHFCGKMFDTMDTLMSHICADFMSFIANRALLQEIVKPVVKLSYMFLVCTDCSLWLPIKSDYVGDRFSRAWSFFATVLKYHSSCSFVPFVVNFLEPPSKPDLRLELKFVQGSIKCMEIACRKCGVNFNSLRDAEDHYSVNHPTSVFSCKRAGCGKLFRSEILLIRHHMSHWADGFKFASYLKQNARYYPPMHEKNQASRIGCDSQQVVGVGGRATSLVADKDKHKYHDHVNDGRPLLKEKLRNSILLKPAQFDDSSDEDGYHTDQYRPDGGFEDVKYAKVGLVADKNMAECVKKISKFFESQCDQELSRFTELGPEAKHFIDKKKEIVPEAITIERNGLADEIACLFTHTISLPMSACCEQISDSLLDKNYSFCQECLKILGGPIAERHGCRKEKIIELYNVRLPTNSSVTCPYCSEQRCSIIGLQVHFLFEHGRDVTVVVSDKKKSLNDLSKQNLLKDTRTSIARKTDFELGLGPNGGKLCPSFGSKRPPFQRQARPPGSTIPAPPPLPRASKYNFGLATSNSAFFAPDVSNLTVRGPNKLPPRMRNIIQPSNAPMASNNTFHQIRPYHFRTVAGMEILSCSFCSFSGNSLKALRDHLRFCHAVVCMGCGHAFCSTMKLQDHTITCLKQFKESNLTQLVGSCVLCQVRGDLINLYNHIFDQHITGITYGKRSGRLYTTVQGQHVVSSITAIRPEPSNVSVTLGNNFSVPGMMERQSLLVNGAGTVPVPDTTNQSQTQTRTVAPTGGEPTLCINLSTNDALIYTRPEESFGMCYLCGFEADSQELVEAHLRRHPQFKKCFLCKDEDVAITSHEHMLNHLQEKHYEQLDSDRIKCKSCSLIVDQREVSHVIYDCRANMVCAFCPNECFSNLHTWTVHWWKFHRKEFQRFECTECHLMFPHIAPLERHTCKAARLVRTCNCGCPTFFRNQAEFAKHFSTHTIRDKFNAQICRLCGLYLATDAAFRIHQNSHTVVLGNSGIRKIACVDRELFAIEHCPSSSVLQKDVVTAGPSAPSSPPTESSGRSTPCEEAEIEHTTAQVIHDLVKRTCLAAGEDWEEMLNDDADLIIIEPARNPGTMLSACVRTEANDNVAAGASQPGYVEDDDDDSQVGTPPETVVREITDDIGDSEIAVVAEVSHPSGTTSAVVSSRNKNFQCAKCSQAFITKASLLQHMTSAHSNDAGGITENVYGVPLHGNYLLCRNCCVVFETTTQYENHMKAHGQASAISCPECSTISYNTILYEQHRNAHTEGRLFYACGECSVMYKTEARLNFHTRIAHNEPILFFCKMCNITASSMQAIVLHLSKSQCMKQLLKRRQTAEETVGMCPYAVVHFQPENEQEFVRKVATGLLTVAKPSDCVHRTFLAPTEAVVSCKECHCVMSLATYTAIENHKHGYQVTVQLTVEAGTDNPFRVEMSSNATPPIRMKEPRVIPGATTLTNLLNGSGNSLSATSTNDLFPVRTTQNRNRQQEQNESTGHTGGSPMQPSTSSSSTPTPAVGSNSTVDVDRRSPTQGGTATISEGQPLTLASLFPAPTTSRVSSPAPASVVSAETPASSLPKVDDDIVDLTEDGDAMNVPSSSSSTSSATATTASAAPASISTSQPRRTPPAQPAPSSAPREQCEVCHGPITNPQVRKLHRLHDEKKDWFCLECAIECNSEMDAVKHFYEVHVTATEKIKVREGVTDFRPIRFELVCPLPGCRNATERIVYTTMMSYRNHVNTLHKFEKELGFLSSCCLNRFHTENARRIHEKAHEQFESMNGVEGQCCVLCGVANQWNCMDPTGRYNMTHMGIHGLNTYGMCRWCFTCFPDDDAGVRTIQHFLRDHCTSEKKQSVFCKLCMTLHSFAHINQHIRQKHFVRGFKSHDNQVGQLIVRVGQQTQIFLGLSPS